MNSLQNHENFPITKIDPVERWMLSVRASTRVPYKNWFRRYIIWCGSEEPDLLEKAKDINWLDVNLKQWYQELKRQGLSSNTRAHGHAAIRSFYSSNNIALPRFPRETMGRAAYESDYIYAKDEIRAMLRQATTTRDRAILLFLANAPQREEVITCLKWRMLSEQISKGGIIVLSIPEELPNAQGENCNKNAIKYRFGLGREVGAKILQMMEERKAQGEPIGPESWVFRSYAQFRSRNPIHLSKDSEGPQLHPQAINYTVTTLAEKAGIQKVVKTAKMTRALFHAHGFRRYWKATIRDAWKHLKAPIDSDLLKFEIGDTVDQAGAYDKFSENYIREVHEELEPHLQITEPSITQPSTSEYPGQNNEEVEVRPVIPQGGFIEQNGATLLSLLLLNQVKLGRIEEELLAIRKDKTHPV